MSEWYPTDPMFPHRRKFKPDTYIITEAQVRRVKIAQIKAEIKGLRKELAILQAMERGKHD